MRECVYTVLMAILTFIPCNFGESTCVYDGDNAYLERPDVYFR
jgi:hypothetical protein